MTINDGDESQIKMSLEALPLEQVTDLHKAKHALQAEVFSLVGESRGLFGLAVLGLAASDVPEDIQLARQAAGVFEVVMPERASRLAALLGVLSLGDLND